MNVLTNNLIEHWASELRATWDVHRKPILRMAVGLLSLYAALKLGDEFRRLIFETGRGGAIDLRLLQNFVIAWFDGRPVYSEFSNAAYPPASFALLYPFIGWLDFNSARLLWAITTIAVLGGTSHLLVRASQAVTLPDRALVVLMLLAMNGTGVAVGNGQLGLHTLFALLVVFFALAPGPHALGRDLVAVAFFILALVKPSISVPFGWLVLFWPRGGQRIFLVAVGYIALTVCAASFQTVPLDLLLRDELARGAKMVSTYGYANLDVWLTNLGLGEWSLYASGLALAGLGAWIYVYRHTDRWILVGVSALVARLWMYHWSYDNVLVVLPMIALFRIAKRDWDGIWGTLAGTLLAINIGAMLFLASWEFGAPPWSWIFVWGHSLVWTADLIFLMAMTRRQPAECPSV